MAKEIYRKLEIYEESILLLINPPSDYFGLIECTDFVPERTSSIGKAEVIHIFSNSERELRKHLVQFSKTMTPNAKIWVSWYKKSSGLQSELNYNIITMFAKPLGFVDVKVCSLNQHWTSMKLVIRRDLRD